MKLKITYENVDYYGEEILDRVEIEGISKTLETVKLVFKDCTESPEDASFYRDLNSVLSIRDLVKLAYNAGKNGESLEIEEDNIKDED